MSSCLYHCQIAAKSLKYGYCAKSPDPFGAVRSYPMPESAAQIAGTFHAWRQQTGRLEDHCRGIADGFGYDVLTLPIRPWRDVCIIAV